MGGCDTTVDVMGLLLTLLLPLLVMVVMFFFAVPLLKKFATKYTLLFAVAVLAGSIAGLVLSDEMFGYIASGCGFVFAMYLFYVAWSIRVAQRRTDTSLPTPTDENPDTEPLLPADPPESPNKSVPE